MNEVLAANNLTMTGLNELWQEERDLISYAFEGAKTASESETRIAVATLEKEGRLGSAATTSTGGDLVSNILGKIGTKILSNVFKVDVPDVT